MFFKVTLTSDPHKWSPPFHQQESVKNLIKIGQKLGCVMLQTRFCSLTNVHKCIHTFHTGNTKTMSSNECGEKISPPKHPLLRNSSEPHFVKKKNHIRKTKAVDRIRVKVTSYLGNDQSTEVVRKFSSVSKTFKLKIC